MMPTVGDSIRFAFSSSTVLHAIIALLLLTFSTRVLAQDESSDRAIVLAYEVALVKRGEAVFSGPKPCGDASHISHEFRDTAGDTFDEVLSLEAAELKGQLFYEPILRDAERAVLKAKRKAANKDEESLAECLSDVETYATAYRSATEMWNLDKKLFNMTHAKKYKRHLDENEEFLRALKAIQVKADDAIQALLKQR